MNIVLMTDELIYAAVIIMVLLLDFFTDRKKIIGWFFTIATFALLVFILADKYYGITGRESGVLWNGSFIRDNMAWFAKVVLLTGAFFTGLMSIDTISLKKRHTGAYYMILGASTLGMMFLVSSRELVTMYVALELAAISLYALASFRKDDESLEGGMKYVILGAFSSGMLLYGLSLVYGATGTTYLDGIMISVSGGSVNIPILAIGMIFILLGIGFKLSMVPMHMWTPDVYQGAPMPITAFISVASKAAGFVFAVRIFSYAFINFKAGAADPLWVPIIAVLAFLTMTIGNLIAIPQRNIKRLLAYSSISQAGYILVGFVGASVIGMSAVLFYLMAYTVTNIAAFAVLAVVERSTGSNELDGYSGLARRQPLLAFTLLAALLSLAGIPPLVGFAGKVYLFYAAMEKGFLWLVIAGALNSTISLYYYLLILKRMYMWDKKEENPPKIHVPVTVRIVLIAAVAAMLIFGILPGLLVDTTLEAALGMFR